jgi:hypothetical protein
LSSYPPGGAPGYPWGAPGYYPPPYYYSPGLNLVPPTTLPYEEGQTVPSGYRLKTRPVRSLVITGSITFGATYLISLIVGATAVAQGGDNKSFAALFAPVVGPFISIGTIGSSGAGTLWLVIDGLTQTAGAAMLITGLAVDEKFLQRAATGSVSPLEALAHPQLLVGPRSAALRWTL